MAKESVEEISAIVAPAGIGHTRNSEASILPFEDGRLLMAWSDFYGGNSADEGLSRISARWSKDEGQSWGEPFVLQENIGKLNCMSASLLRLAGGPGTKGGRCLFVFGRKDGQPGLAGGEAANLHAMAKWSDDEGKTWSQPRDVTRGDAYWCMTNDRLVQLKSGRILYPIEERAAGCHVWYSDDRGETWQMSRRNIPNPPKIDYAEPTVIELSDSRIAMYIRNKSGNLHMALSEDGGESWRPHKMHGPDMAGHPHCGPNSAEAPCVIKRVPGTRDLVMVWNNNKVRTPLTAAVSSDDGETWRHYRDVEPMDGWPPRFIHTYPSLEFIGGNAHLTYGQVRIDWSEEKGEPKMNVMASLRYRRLPVAWFYANA